MPEHTFAPIEVTDADRSVGRPAHRVGESPIEYGVRCIAWADERVVEYLTTDRSRGLWTWDSNQHPLDTVAEAIAGGKHHA